jgi:dihydroflavonol-4-reductase
MNLVTGASGLLGSHVVLELLCKREEVRAFCRNGDNPDLLKKLAKFYQCEDRIHWDQLSWFKGDVLNVDDLFRAFEGVNHVYHCAASVSYHRKDRKAMYQINVDGTANIVNTALLFPEIRLCHVSSIAALGRTRHMQTVKESDEWTNSSIHTHYAISKHLSENEVWRGMEEGLNAVIVNPALIMGPGPKGQSSNAILEHVLKQWNYFPVGGTGVIHVRDVAQSMIGLMNQEVSGERFTICSENILYKDLWQMAAQRLKVKIPQNPLPSWLPKLALVVEGFKEFFTGKKAAVTRETVSNMELRFLYDSQKINGQLGLSYRTMDESIRDAVDFIYT